MLPTPFAGPPNRTFPELDHIWPSSRRARSTRRETLCGQPQVNVCRGRLEVGESGNGWRFRLGGNFDLAWLDLRNKCAEFDRVLGDVGQGYPDVDQPPLLRSDLYTTSSRSLAGGASTLAERRRRSEIEALRDHTKFTASLMRLSAAPCLSAHKRSAILTFRDSRLLRLRARSGRRTGIASQTLRNNVARTSPPRRSGTISMHVDAACLAVL